MMTSGWEGSVTELYGHRCVYAGRGSIQRGRGGSRPGEGQLQS